jgi:DNA-directed RNA polymerase subunit RPC12/RpoP
VALMSAAQREETRYIRELKKQIQRLKKENQQLRKAKRVLEATFMEFQYEEEEEFQLKPKQKQKLSDKNKEDIKCPKCNAEDIFIFELRGAPYYRCSECQSKGKI